MAAQPTDGAVHFALGAFQQSVGILRGREAPALARWSSTPERRDPELSRIFPGGQGTRAALRGVAHPARARGRSSEAERSSDSLGWALYKQNRLEEAETALLRGG